MNYPRGALALFVLLMISSCSILNNSFNTYTLTTPKTTSVTPGTATPDAELVEEAHPPAANVGLTVQAVPQKIVVETGGDPCKVSPYPEPGKPPEYPAQPILAADGDLNRIELIERKHIDDLRAYISERRRMNKEARETFEKKCIAVTRH